MNSFLEQIARSAAALVVLLAAASPAITTGTWQGSGPPAQTQPSRAPGPGIQRAYPPPRPWYPHPAPYQRAFGVLPPGYGLPYWPNGRAATVNGGPRDIIAALEESEEFTTFLQAINRAELTERLRSAGPYTVFAPINAAFDALPDGVLETLLEDGERLKAVLEYHIVEGRLTAADLLVAGKVGTLEGHSIEKDDLSVQRADVKAGNGVIHVLDEVMPPPLF